MYLSVYLLFCICVTVLNAGNVIELDDRVIEYTKQGKWLLMFYAPWCGHCKRLEPVYEEVATHYKHSSINVARIDTTRHMRAGTHFEIRGFPTLKFISPNGIFNFHGDRKQNDIIEFVERADGPRTRTVQSRLDFVNAKSKHKLFFLLISENEDDTVPLVKNFKELANKHFLNAYFFLCTNKEILAKEIQINSLPTVVVVKEEGYFNFESQNQNDLNELEKFIKIEEFLTFSQLSITNFQNLIETRKTLIILLTKVNDEQNESSNKNDFQFAHTDNAELLSGIAIWTLNTPIVFVLNSTNYKYSLIYVNENDVPEKDDIDRMLNDVREQKLEFHGGDGWFRQVRRPFWELYRAILEMFHEAPFISLLVFGLPFSVISVVCYFLCCFETTNEQNEMEELTESDDEEGETPDVECLADSNEPLEGQEDQTDDNEDKKNI